LERIMTRDFLLPDLGEGLTESELVAWHVVVGQLVELNQPIAEIETAKAIVQLPSPFAGVISELYVDEGSTVAVGARLVAFDLDVDEPLDNAPFDAPPFDEAPIQDVAAAPVERNSVLVGYGPPVETQNRPKRKRPSLAPGDGVSTSSTTSASSTSGASPATSASSTNSTPPRTTPPVRKLAADHDIDLANITATGADGMITRDDVLHAAAGAPAEQQAPSIRPRETRIAIRGVRKATAEAMVRSAFTAPHVTVFLTVDVTATLELVAQLREKTDQPITLLSVVAKALCISAHRNPTVNSRWDESAGEMVEFGYVNLGIAVATPRGLLVPNIRDADAMRLPELAASISSLAQTARDGATSPEAFTGGTISISNVGVFGVDAGTPILNPGEAAILAMGAVRREPREFHGTIALRDVMTLSLSFDHRLVDGEQGSRFLTEIGAILTNPGVVLAMV
jgi:2-oxoisovalerate dehydrogenase E2 component (dihydrolipoyl transacylase)